LKTIKLTAIILTCYNLSFYEFVDSAEVSKSSPPGKADVHVELKASENVNQNVQIFITHYESIYEFIELSKNTPGNDNKRICLELKNTYDGLNCDNMLQSILRRTGHTLGLLLGSKRIGGNKWKYKYLK